MACELECLNDAIPCHLATEKFNDGLRLDVSGLTLVHRLNGLPKLFGPFAHPSIISTRLATVQGEFVTLASIAGVQRIAVFVLTKL
jgi:hypothetical protein